GFLRLVNYSNALVLDIRLDSRGQATAAIPDVSYVGVAAVPGSPAFYSWTGRVPAPLPGNVILNVTRTRPHTDDFLDVTITNWSSGRAWLNRTLASDPFTRFNADLTYDADGMLTSEEIRNAFKFLWPGIVLGVILQADNYSVPVSRAGPDEGVGVGLVETGDPITLAMPGSLALPEVESSSHTLVVNLTGGNPYYTPAARVRVPLEWNITNVATANGVVVSGVGTRGSHCGNGESHVPLRRRPDRPSDNPGGPSRTNLRSHLGRRRNAAPGSPRNGGPRWSRGLECHNG